MCRVEIPPRSIGLLVAVFVLAGCVNVSARLADNLSQAIQKQNDLATVRDGAPAFLLVVDGLIEGDREDTSLLLSGARLYGSYAGAFVDDEQRRITLATKGYGYATRALCLELAALCAVVDEPFEQYQVVLTTVDDADDVPVLYGHAAAWAGLLQANASDWNAIAQVPKVRAQMEQVVILDEGYDHGTAHLYLGVLATLLPPALGGRPEEGRTHFERAIELSEQQNLMAYVLYARSYARLVFDRDLHDRLLNQVVDRAVESDEFTLINTLAQAEARDLLASADDYF